MTQINEQNKARAKLLEMEQRDRREKDLRELMALPAFRRYAWDLLSYCRVFSDGWDASARIHFNAGQRNVGLRAFAEIQQTCPEQYALMAQEQFEQERKDALLLETES